MRRPPPLRALIADDEAGARAHLSMLLERAHVRTVAECATGQDVLAAVARARPGIICLDVRMPDLDGLEVARRLGNPPNVVFTTGYAEHASAAFEVGAADYLVKPLSAERVAEAVRRVRARLGRLARARGASWPVAPRAVADGSPQPSIPPSVPRVYVPAGDHRAALALETIRFVEARGCEAHVHTDRGTFRFRFSLGRLEALLAPWGFLRTHRAFLVNMSRVQALVPWSRHVHTVLLDDGQETHVPVAKSRLAVFRGSVIWIPQWGGTRSGPGTAGEDRDRGGCQPGAGPRDRRGVGG
ncbi:MAG: LytTR family DNA-binding domain-containing protein [Candidatus Rokubacteria bacterium]|nr:LytTR family DNA-binding domain-containing protein [Candidatus Rokubacteria bacterium]